MSSRLDAYCSQIAKIQNYLQHGNSYCRVSVSSPTLPTMANDQIGRVEIDNIELKISIEIVWAVQYGPLFAAFCFPTNLVLTFVQAKKPRSREFSEGHIYHSMYPQRRNSLVIYHSMYPQRNSLVKRDE